MLGEVNVLEAHFFEPPLGAVDSPEELFFNGFRDKGEPFASTTMSALLGFVAPFFDLGVEAGPLFLTQPAGWVAS